MAAKIPYMLSPGLIPKILEKIQNAKRPDRFTQDFLETKLGHSGGSARAIIPLLKRLEFLGSDGVPTPLYDQYRNTDTQGYAIAKGMQNAFTELFDRNEYVYEMPKDKLTGLVIEITGATSDDRVTQAIIGTFSALNELADFESEPSNTSAKEVSPENVQQPNHGITPTYQQPSNTLDNVELKVGYTINLNLPETTDPEVFNAIFKSLKENLLRD